MEQKTENTTLDRDGDKWNPEGNSLRDAFNTYIARGADALGASEYRALQKDLDVGGGFLVVPQEVSKSIFADLDNELWFRSLATIIKVPHAESFRVPKMHDDFGDPTWTAELGSGVNDTNLDFIAVDFTPRPIARRIKISYDLLRVSSMNPENFVRQMMIQVLSQVLENAYLQGTGSPGPIGLFTASQCMEERSQSLNRFFARRLLLERIAEAPG